MKRAAGVEDFALEPVGHFLAGKCWLLFCAHAELWGVTLFGQPDRGDAEALARAFEAELGPAIPRHDVLVDAHSLDGIDAGAFDTLQAFARQNLERSRASVTRLALVLPRGVSGAVVAGFYGVLGAPCPMKVVETRAEALAWLTVPPTVAQAVDAALSEVRDTPPLLSALRAILCRRLLDADSEAIANQLGLSERTLQRRLAEAGTSFHKELQSARIDEARRRLAGSDDAITAVALELGFASSQHFSRQFRRATGQSPSEWRARHRTLAPSAGSS